MLIECCNILWKHTQRGRFTDAIALRRMDVLSSLTGTHVPTWPLARRALEILLKLRHPAYDALTIAVADVEAARVVTADIRLLNRAANTSLAPLLISLQDAAAN